MRFIGRDSRISIVHMIHTTPCLFFIYKRTIAQNITCWEQVFIRLYDKCKRIRAVCLHEIGRSNYKKRQCAQSCMHLVNARIIDVANTPATTLWSALKSVELGGVGHIKRMPAVSIGDERTNVVGKVLEL